MSTNRNNTPAPSAPQTSDADGPATVSVDALSPAVQALISAGIAEGLKQVVTPQSLLVQQQLAAIAKREESPKRHAFVMQMAADALVKFDLGLIGEVTGLTHTAAGDIEIEGVVDNYTATFTIKRTADVEAAKQARKGNVSSPASATVWKPSLSTN